MLLYSHVYSYFIIIYRILKLLLSLPNYMPKLGEKKELKLENERLKAALAKPTQTCSCIGRCPRPSSPSVSRPEGEAGRGSEPAVVEAEEDGSGEDGNDGEVFQAPMKRGRPNMFGGVRQNRSQIARRVLTPEAKCEGHCYICDVKRDFISNHIINRHGDLPNRRYARFMGTDGSFKTFAEHVKQDLRG